IAQPITRRVKTSKTATRYNQPWPVRTQVASVVQTWLGLLTARPRSRLGAIGPPWSLSVVATLYLDYHVRRPEPESALKASRSSTGNPCWVNHSLVLALTSRLSCNDLRTSVKNHRPFCADFH